MRRSWGVEAAVIYPPVDTAALLAGGNWADKLAGTDHDIAASLPPVFVLGASRFIDYKKLDV